MWQLVHLLFAVIGSSTIGGRTSSISSSSGSKKGSSNDSSNVCYCCYSSNGGGTVSFCLVGKVLKVMVSVILMVKVFRKLQSMCKSKCLRSACADN